MAITKEVEQKIQTRASAEKVEDIESRTRKLEKFCEFEGFRKKVAQIINESFGKEEFRNKSKSVINDHLRKDEVITLIKKYAGREIDARRLKSSYRMNSIITSAIVAGIITIVGWLLSKFL
ncbi:hypothetical protein HQ544_04925 [Candidatus Falkowbacteria bacterium]|nr:hypothetical protein [Candidatus Falkowbacteria bacterium]